VKNNRDEFKDLAKSIVNTVEVARDAAVANPEAYPSLRSKVTEFNEYVSFLIVGT
jgi:hypothetical protein